MDDEIYMFRYRAIMSILGAGQKKYPKVLIGDQDVHLERPDGHRIRYGYFDGYTFRRENPAARSIRCHYRNQVSGVLSINEGVVEFGKKEPQYDLIVRFNSDSSIHAILDTRTCQEVEAY